ncbi:hypothetical protein [Aquidulcibacter sp.]|jgi:hypothetical protein|uniref:hypothetical protein n=1 Tax=Aquidulcibacter sp. TaxID=2052990 RepID=UPI0037BE7E78
MTNFAFKQVLGIAAIGLALVSPLTSAQADTAGPSRLAAAIQTYQTATNEGRAMAAQALRRALAADSDAPAATKAEASFLLGDFALRDGKKDLALKQANQGLKLLEGSGPTYAPAVRAFGARIKTQALLAKEERLEAYKLILEARFAYGAPKIGLDSAWDKVWDDLYLWQRIASSELVGVEAAVGAAFRHGYEAELTSLLQQDGECGDQNTPLVLTNWENNKPNYPIVPLFANQTGGVMMRISVDADGRVTTAMPTAFSPSEDFAIMTERASKEWIAKGDRLEEAACRVGRPIVVVFRLF